jgi:hypothetical protein
LLSVSALGLLLDRSRRDVQHGAVQRPAFGKIERVDLDLGGLAGADKANVAVLHHCFDLEPAIERHHFEQRLSRGHDPAYRVYGELLDLPVDRRAQDLQP